MAIIKICMCSAIQILKHLWPKDQEKVVKKIFGRFQFLILLKSSTIITRTYSKKAFLQKLEDFLGKVYKTIFN